MPWEAGLMNFDPSLRWAASGLWIFDERVVVQLTSPMQAACMARSSSEASTSAGAPAAQASSIVW